MHEGLGSISAWRDFPAQLCQQTGIAGFLYSRNGYGQSPVFAAPLNTDFMHVEAQQVLPTLLQSQGIKQPILIGHSDGASISLIYSSLAPSEPNYPSPIAMVAIAPHIFVEQICTDSIAALNCRFQSDDRLRAGLDRHHRDAHRTFNTWRDAWLSPEFKDWNIESLLPAIQCEVLAIQGSADQYGTMAQVNSLAAHHPQTTVIELADCGHSPHVEHSEQVLTIIEDFVNKARA